MVVHEKGEKIHLELEKYGTKIVRVLPSAMQGPDALSRIIGQVALACSLTPKLMECDTRSLLFEIYRAARLGLDISGASGQAYLIPFGPKATLVIGYRGMITLACRATGVKSIRGVVVFEGEPFEYTDGLAPILRHSPTVGRQKPSDGILCAYAVATWADGATAWKVAPGWYLAEIRDAALAKAGGRATPWSTNVEEMIAKTAVRYLCKGLDMSPDVARAIHLDDQVASGTYAPESDPDWAGFDEAPPEQSRQSEMAARMTKGNP